MKKKSKVHGVEDPLMCQVRVGKQKQAKDQNEKEPRASKKEETEGEIATHLEPRLILSTRRTYGELDGRETADDESES